MKMKDRDPVNVGLGVVMAFALLLIAYSVGGLYVENRITKSCELLGSFHQSSYVYDCVLREAE